ncbi:FtsX-like permease family protein [Nocardioides nematodiphilus]|uniref:FtsX-like permease family protein n=1 Tax=Nocardioides nematodiphilus TaxID=2849669 RepID=UPI001CDA1D71|nr:FtsX-like permease family protein [Nocardioides nematodiphilus]MCA1984443.1 hypothetical protein [Nocardioides nematodiphilus]
MIRLAWRLAFARGWARPALLAACTAVVSGLLLVTLAVLRLPAQPEERLLAVITDPGTRGGYAFGAALLIIPPLLLLHQVVRLGTSARERRLAALRLAGATPAEVRRIGAIEVGIPVFAGSILGLGLYRLLRLCFGGTRFGEYPSHAVHLIPTTVAPAWWETLLVILGVTLLGVAVGALASRRVIVTPLGVTRRAAAPAPRPWGALALALAVVSGLAAMRVDGPQAHTLGMAGALVAIALALLGVMALAPWLAFTAGRIVARRARTGPVLLAASRLVAEPRPAARAAAAVGGIGLVAGGASAFVADVMAMQNDDDGYYLAPVALVAVCLLGALVVVVGSLAVHSVESLLDHRRSVASLTALGVPVDTLITAQRWETGLVALPMALIGTLLGSVVYGLGPVGGPSFVWFACTIVGLTLVAALCWVAVLAAVRVVRPWTVRAADPAHLRTE